MYLGSNQYPEFLDKDKKYKMDCIKFCYNKANMGRRFWFIAILLIVFSILWGCWIEDLALGIYADSYGFLFPIVMGVLFWFYLLYEINVTIRQSVKKYIVEFENSINEARKLSE